MAVAAVDLREVEVILNNRTVQAPVRVTFHQNTVEVRVNIHGEDGQLAAVHEIEVCLVGKKVVMIVRSPLGTRPVAQVLHDFAGPLSEGDKG